MTETKSSTVWKTTKTIQTKKNRVSLAGTLYAAFRIAVGVGIIYWLFDVEMTPDKRFFLETGIALYAMGHLGGQLYSMGSVVETTQEWTNES